MVKIKALSKGNNFVISSFCSVATKEVKEECLLLIYTINRLYKVPIVIFCDLVTKIYLEDQAIKNVYCVVREVTETNVLKKNHYHKPDVIALKMDVLEYAIIRYRNSVFLDSDIILLKELDGPSDCNVALSHNLTETRDVAKQSNLDGMFNAGMIWCNSVEFPRWWRDEYLLGRSIFYEQSILNYVPAKFRTSYFSLQHNYGFWRGSVKDREVKSFHCHLGKRLDKDFIPLMNEKVNILRKTIINILENSYPELYLQYERIFQR